MPTTKQLTDEQVMNLYCRFLQGDEQYAYIVPAYVDRFNGVSPEEYFRALEFRRLEVVSTRLM